MIRQLVGLWRRLQRGRPGRRFQDHYARHSRATAGLPRWRRTLAGLLGAGLVIVGVALMPLPGPGALVVALGLLLISGVSPRAGAFLDRWEVRLWAAVQALAGRWARSPVSARLLAALLLAALAGLGGYALYGWLAPPD